MKYFTRELIARGQSEDDDVLDEVEETWYQLGVQYRAYLATVKDRLPRGLRHIRESYYLHDARVHGLGRSGDRFIVYLQLDPPPESLLTFRYLLVEEPIIDGVHSGRNTHSICEWQYDELELVPGDPPTWRQSILLSNGWEITLHFRDVEVEEVQAILPVPRHSASAAVTELPQTA